MQKSFSLEKINGSEGLSNARESVSKSSNVNSLPKKKRRRYEKIFEQYCITIKPKLHRSSSLSDLTTNASDFSLDLFKHAAKHWTTKFEKYSLYGSSGDTLIKYETRQPTAIEHMSWNFKGKRNKNKKEMTAETTYAAKFASEYVQSSPREAEELNSSSVIEESSEFSVDPLSGPIGAAFPFKSTPSGNLKVQSNQVVFQSSTLGVLLADPTQAKIKIKFEDNANCEAGDDVGDRFEMGSECEVQPQYRQGKLNTNKIPTMKLDKNTKHNLEGIRDVKGENLNSLGYAAMEPVDWMRVQLPKKLDLFQELYRRIHNRINTDTIIRIGDEEFHCHHMVLQVYSTYFNTNIQRKIELSNVKSEAFRSIYEWMIASGTESSKILTQENILDLFSAAEFLKIKDLQDQCWSFIVNENIFNEDTAFALYREARLKGISPVVELMIPRVMKFFLPLVASKDFLDLEPEEVITFLRSNYVCVSSEIEVLMSAIRWLRADWPARRRLMVDLMKCVRFGLVSPWQLVDIKRNPDNAEILDIVNEPQVQQMVDDGLAYVIIKYWYGNNSKNYNHWIDVLGLSEPAERNWIGEEQNHVTYRDFLKYLEQFSVPRDQMYQQMAMMRPPRRNDEAAGSMRGVENCKMDIRIPKVDFPLPTVLTDLTGDKDKFPTVNKFLDSRGKTLDGFRSPPPPLADINSVPIPMSSKRSPQVKKHQTQLEKICNAASFSEEITTDSGSTAVSGDTSVTEQNQRAAQSNAGERRHSVAASYLASATAALAGTRSPPPVYATMQPVDVHRPNVPKISSPPKKKFLSPRISLFNRSKETLARINMNKLSASILGPSNKNYITEGSLFDWDKETVLVFGGIDPHTTFGLGRNTGKDIYRFDPVANVWECVGELPEPRHHHSIAFLRGRVYLVGGADPRDDDMRGKSVVVSTVWSYEPVTRSWYSESGLAIPRKNFGLVVHKMALYAIGGQDKKGRVLRSVERFDPRSGSWGEVRPLGTARMAAASVKYRDYIWVAGGMTGERRRPVCGVVECYNSTTDQWTEIHNLRFPRCFCTLFAMNDKLYLVGGAGKITEKEKTASSVSSIDVWNWGEREWRPETDMSIPRHGHALAYLGTQLIIIGGVTTIYMRALNNVESFCCERNAWIRGVAPLPSPLSGHGAVTLPPASLM